MRTGSFIYINIIMFIHKMATITISIPEELKKELEKHSEVNWTEVIRRIFINKINLLKKLERLEK